MALPITITNAGRAEIINGQNTGTGPVTITQIGFGTGQYNPAKTQTALQAQVKRLGSIAGQAVADDTIHVMAKDESTDTYNVGEFGLFSDKGTLIAVYSQPAASGWIIQKAGPSTLLLATDIILESLDATSITFGDILFINPPATESVAGVVMLVNNLITGNATRALTAAMGKKLQDEKAPLSSPALTGTPTAPTPAASSSNTQIATTAFVKAVVAALVDSSPAALDTLKELATALGNDPNFATTMTNALAAKAPLASPALSGTPTAPTAVAGTSTTQIATTAFVAAVQTALTTLINARAPLASPALTGTPTAPTPATSSSNTQIATTAFVKAVVAALVDSSPAALDTLKELATALGNDPNFATTMTNALAAKAPLVSPALSGTPTAPTAVAGTRTKQLATTEFVALSAAATVPPGMPGFFPGNTAPTGWLKANGAAVSRTTYAALFAAIGTTFGAGNGSTTFNLPDLRGEFIRGWDDGRGIDPGRGFGSSQLDALQQITGTAISRATYGMIRQGDGSVSGAFKLGSATAGCLAGTSSGANNLEFDASLVARTASETRPRNIAMLACIKY